MRRLACLILPFFWYLTGCLPAAVHPAFHKVDALPRFTLADASEGLRTALQHSLQVRNRETPTPPCPWRGAAFSRYRRWETLSLFLEVLAGASDAEALRTQIALRFDLYAVTEPVLFTAYYQPFLEGSPVPTERFRYPLYRRPPERRGRWQRSCLIGAVPVVGKAPRPYLSREEIDLGGALDGRGLELLYLDSAIERFVLHIQGAGDIRMPDGRILHVQYDGSNERPYTSVGRLLRDSGRLGRDEINLPRIKTYLRNHPEEAPRIMNENERYIFFRESAHGAEGAGGTRLTPYRSLATDPQVIPSGTVCFYDLPVPEFDAAGNATGLGRRSGFAVSQDVGAAIRGPHRVDLFAGRGPEAERLAGHLQTRGRLYLLVPKSTATDRRCDAE